MYGLIVGIILFVSILLVLIVLVQNPKGGGLASSFSSPNQIMGVKRTADFVEKATWYFALGIAVLCILATMLPRDAGLKQQSKIQDQLENSAMDPGRAPAAYPTPTQPQPTDNPQPQQPVE
jgi:preprotein translocase subunit SecG